MSKKTTADLCQGLYREPWPYMHEAAERLQRADMTLKMIREALAGQNNAVSVTIKAWCDLALATSAEDESEGP